MTDLKYEIKKEHNFNPEIPPLQGDYAKTIFLWYISKPQPIHCHGDYAAYFLYECGIRDCVAYHKNLINEGYLTEARPIEALHMFKVPELREMLRELGCSVSGKKEMLIERIRENAEEGYLSKYISDTVYGLSLKGQTFLTEHEDYIEIHKHTAWGISWKEYDAYTKPGQDFLSTVWYIMKERLEKNNLQESRYTYYNLYQILLEQGKRSDALELLLKVLYLDYSGIFESLSFDLYRQNIYTKERLKELTNNYAFIAPAGIVHTIKELSDYYDPYMIDLLYEWNLPIQICDKKLFRKIVEDAVNDTLDKEEITRNLQAAFEKYVDSL